MAAIVRREKRTSQTVWRYSRIRSSGLKPMINPLIKAAARIPVPVAESQLKAKMAFSGAAPGGATGGARSTILCKWVTLISGAEIRLREVFTLGTPQRKTIALRRIQGSQACARPGATVPTSTVLSGGVIFSG